MAQARSMVNAMNSLRSRPAASVAAAVAAFVVLCPAAPALGRDIVSYAFVQDDATLRIRGSTFRLFGTYVPDRSRQCTTTVRPVRCGLTRAAKALDFRIQGFVRCTPVRTAADGVIEAYCATGGGARKDEVDLGLYLIERGLALATPDAPFAYQAAEKIARANQMGVWGFQVDVIKP